MVRGQRYVEASMNGMSDRPLQIGSPTLANIINGWWDKPMHKIKGALPYFDERRTEPLKSWEIIEIQWKSFAQEVGQLQGYGWKFNPNLLNAYNQAKANIDSLKQQIKDEQASLTQQQGILNALRIKQSDINQSISEFENFSDDFTLNTSDTGQNPLELKPQQNEIKNNKPYPLTLIELKSQNASMQMQVDNQQALVTGIENQITNLQNDLKNAEDAFAKDFADVPVDQLGLTDAFIHAVYTEFCKRFWRYNIGQTNPLDWFLLLNSFFGNYLPMVYKAAEVIANSPDFSTRSWQTGSAQMSGSLLSSQSNRGRDVQDQEAKGQSNQASNQTQEATQAASTTPQNRLNLNVKNVDYANNVQSQETTNTNKGQDVNQNIGGTSHISSAQQDSSQTNNTNNLTNGQQFQLNPLEVWNRVMQENGLFFDLWDKALAYGLFDGVQ